MNKLSRVGIDLAKNVFQLHGVDRHGKAIWRRRLTRDKWLRVLLENIEPGSEIGMEACAGAHHWARHAACHIPCTNRIGVERTSDTGSSLIVSRFTIIPY